MSTLESWVKGLPPVIPDGSRQTKDWWKICGVVGDILGKVAGEFLECGNVGLKICRVADSSAHLFAKEFTFKLGDIAPGDLILREARG